MRLSRPVVGVLSQNYRFDAVVRGEFERMKDVVHIGIAVSYTHLVPEQEMLEDIASASSQPSQSQSNKGSAIEAANPVI